MKFGDEFFKKVEKKTNVSKDTILSLAEKLQKGNMKDEKTLSEVIDTLSKMTGKKVSDEQKSKIIKKVVEDKVPNNVEKQWDDTLKQYYIEYASGKNTIKMWIEDGASIKEKVALVTKYNLGGAACWKKDMETSNIWSIIKTELANTSTEK